MTRAFLLSSSLLAFALALSPTLDAAPADDGNTTPGAPSAKTSLVRVNVTSQAYNFFRPWEKQALATRRGLGAVLHGNRVLITAEMVANASYIELEMPDTGEKVTAEVVGVDYEANLAIVSPADETSGFLAGRVPLDIATDATVGDTLEIWQIEDTGDPVLTEAELIKIEIGPYFLESSYFLVYQLRGPLQYRSGSFTLPVVKDGKLAGLLLSYSSKDQTSDILAGPIIAQFLDALETNPYPGFPHLGINYSQTLDEQLRGYVGLENGQGGVFVSKVIKGSSADDAGLKVGDVLLELGGHPIDSRGNYDHPRFGKINLSHIVRGGADVGSKIPMKFLRDGEIRKITATLRHKKPEAYLVDPYLFDRGPKFLIMGGLIFQELTLPYLKTWGDKWSTQAPFKLNYIRANQEKFEKEGREKIVFLSRVLRTPSTLGYERLSHLIVTKVNGRKINRLDDLEAAFKNPVDGIHKIEFEEFPKVIFVDAAEAEAINMQLQQLGIPELKRLD